MRSNTVGTINWIPVTCKASDVLKMERGIAMLRVTCWPPCSGRMASQRDYATSDQPLQIHPLLSAWTKRDLFGRLRLVSCWRTREIKGRLLGVLACWDLGLLHCHAGRSRLTWNMAEPLGLIIDVLTKSKTIQHVAENLPDIPIVITQWGKTWSVEWWHGRTPLEKADAYEKFLIERAIPDYRFGTWKPWCFRYSDGTKGISHFITRSHWNSETAFEPLREDLLKAKYYPEDCNFLLEFEPTVVHYRVVQALPNALWNTQQ